MIQLILLFYSILSTYAQETTSDGCYQSWTGYRVHCLQPYERRALSSEEECKALCTADYPDCQALLFNHNIYTCDLFRSFILPNQFQQVSYNRKKRQLIPESSLSGPLGDEEFGRFEPIDRIPIASPLKPAGPPSLKVLARFAPRSGPDGAQRQDNESGNTTGYGAPSSSQYIQIPSGFIPAYSSLDTNYKITSYQPPRNPVPHTNGGYTLPLPPIYPTSNKSYLAAPTYPQQQSYPTQPSYPPSVTQNHQPSLSYQSQSYPASRYPPPQTYHPHKKTINIDPDDCGKLGARVELASGYSYLRPTGPCTTVSPTTTPVPIKDCPEGQVADFIVVTDVSIRYRNAVRIPAANPTDCIDACVENRIPSNGSPQRCISAIYDRLRQDCLLSPDETLPPSGEAIPVEGTGNAYYEKICVDETTARICPGPHRRDIQMTLNGFADLVVDAIDFNDCLYQCINAAALYATVCNSGVFYYDEPGLNCVINRETADTQPGFLVTDDENAVDYFQIGCRLRKRARVRTSSRGLINTLPGRSMSLNFLPVPFNERRTQVSNLDLGGTTQTWGAWNICGTFQDARTYRFRNCDRFGIDNSNCEWESKLCDLSDEKLFQ